MKCRLPETPKVAIVKSASVYWNAYTETYRLKLHCADQSQVPREAAETTERNNWERFSLDQRPEASQVFHETDVSIWNMISTEKVMKRN